MFFFKKIFSLLSFFTLTLIHILLALDACVFVTIMLFRGEVASLEGPQTLVALPTALTVGWLFLTLLFPSLVQARGLFMPLIA